MELDLEPLWNMRVRPPVLVYCVIAVLIHPLALRMPDYCCSSPSILPSLLVWKIQFNRLVASAPSSAFNWDAVFSKQPTRTGGPLRVH